MVLGKLLAVLLPSLALKPLLTQHTTIRQTIHFIQPKGKTTINGDGFLKKGANEGRTISENSFPIQVSDFWTLFYKVGSKGKSQLLDISKNHSSWFAQINMNLIKAKILQLQITTEVNSIYGYWLNCFNLWKRVVIYNFVYNILAWNYYFSLLVSQNRVEVSFSSCHHF